MHLQSDYPEYLMEFFILYHPPGNVWSPRLLSVRFLLVQFSQYPPLPMMFPLSNFSSADIPPQTCSLTTNPHFFLLYSKLSPISLPHGWLHCSNSPIKSALLSLTSVMNNFFHEYWQDKELKSPSTEWGFPQKKHHLVKFVYGQIIFNS